MKNIIPVLAVTLIFLPRMSFSATQPVLTPEQIACNQQVDAESSAFWAKQGQELVAFGKANPNSITAHDAHFHASMVWDTAVRTGQSTAGLTPPPPEDPAFQAFLAKEQSDKAAFLMKLGQDRQNCLNPSPAQATTPGT